MSGLDAEGHLAYLGGKSLPGLCHCARNEAHDIEPTSPATAEAYGFTFPPPEFRECRYCAQRIRPARDGDGIDPADRGYYRWVDEGGNPYCGLPPDGPEQIDLIHAPAGGGEDECDGADR